MLRRLAKKFPLIGTKTKQAAVCNKRTGWVDGRNPMFCSSRYERPAMSEHEYVRGDDHAAHTARHSANRILDFRRIANCCL